MNFVFKCDTIARIRAIIKCSRYEIIGRLLVVFCRSNKFDRIQFDIINLYLISGSFCEVYMSTFYLVK